MIQIIPVHMVPANDVRSVRAVDGRVLHAMLDVPEYYEPWLTNYIETYHYQLWLDYVPKFESVRGSPMRVDYVAIDMAWEMASFEKMGQWQALCDFFSGIEQLTIEEYFGSAASVADETLAAAA